MIDTEVYRTVVVFGLITLFVYMFVLPRLLPTNPNNNNNRHNAAATNASTPRRRETGTGGGTPTTIQAKASTPKPSCTRVPPHLSEKSAKVAQWGGMNLLVEGIVPFRYTNAAVSDKQIKALQAENAVPLSSIVRERARVLSNLFHDNNTTSSSSSTPAVPPEKGSTMVIAIPHGDVECQKLRRVLYLLGTYYNVLLIIVVDASFPVKKDMAYLRNKLRGHKGEGEVPLLSTDILPDHRIVAASSVSARVAFTRQLGSSPRKNELVLDFDPQVCEQLSRFGHRVITYGTREDKDAGKGYGTDLSKSKLGKLLYYS